MDVGLVGCSPFLGWRDSKCEQKPGYCRPVVIQDRAALAENPVMCGANIARLCCVRAPKTSFSLKEML
ncbi:hypothetical protein PEC18_21910 [Paucibacter sp. O1-1]|nr:hypothetical protein [Paucibacter sp. O1-1]MDA3828405.1 hypothetical protein [Paucibacter sp. O1-1]